MIQHAFSKPSLVNLISKDANLVFYLSVYPLFHSSNCDYEIDNVYQASCNNAVNMRGKVQCNTVPEDVCLFTFVIPVVDILLSSL